MKTPKIPEEFNAFMMRFYQGATWDFSSEEELIDWALELLGDNERPIAKANLDELLSGKYNEEDLRAMWRSSKADLVPFMGEEGSCTEFLELIQSRFDESERSRKP